MIKFEHSVFALPFALTGALLAFREDGFAVAELGWKAALDRGRDGGGALGRHGVQPPGGRRYRRAQSAHQDAPPARRTAVARLRLGLRGASAALVFLLAAGALNPLCLRLAPVALGIVFFYSFTKRFTSFSHLVLGFAWGSRRRRPGSPMRGSLDPRILWLTAAVTFWTAGFDIIYSCQDYEFDRAEGLFSVPRGSASPERCGVAQALHVAMIVCLLALVHALASGSARLAGVGGHRRAADLRAQPGESRRSVARQRGLLHHERLRQRVILCLLGC